MDHEQKFRHVFGGPYKSSCHFPQAPPFFSTESKYYWTEFFQFIYTSSWSKLWSHCLFQIWEPYLTEPFIGSPCAASVKTSKFRSIDEELLGLPWRLTEQGFLPPAHAAAPILGKGTSQPRSQCYGLTTTTLLLTLLCGSKTSKSIPVSDSWVAMKSNILLLSKHSEKGLFSI